MRLASLFPALIAALFLPLAAPHAAATPYVPPLEASDLTGAEVKLPQDLTASRTLLLIAFEREHQVDVDTWLAVAGRLIETESSFDFLELPTIGPKNAAQRFFIDNGMRSGIPDEAQRKRTVTIYAGKDALLEALALPQQDRIYAVLVNKEGREIWRAEGPVTEETAAALTQKLEETR